MPITKGLDQGRLLILREIIYRDDVLVIEIGNDLPDLSGGFLEGLVTVKSVFDGEFERLEQRSGLLDESVREL